MSAQLQHIADIITKAAGWKNAVPDAEGVFRFSLEGGLDFSLLSPENRTAVLLADLGGAPDAASSQGDEELRRIASLAAASLKKRASAVALAEGRVELHRSFSMVRCSEQDVRLEVRDFLNDLAWWQKQLNGESVQSSSFASTSPFSFSFGDWSND
ncbi:hypothetical protein [Mailhella sp.]|uniref:hypothetical protein n=1 Tax=Mailhella sp. TaxID=1981029 RepID=UPI0040648704